MNEPGSELTREELLARYTTKTSVAKDAGRRSPFKFLDSYSVDDAKIFFGRDSEIEDLLRHFHSYGHVLIYGESGCGKSSLVQCGLRSRIPHADALFLSPRVHTSGLPTMRQQICAEASEQLGEAVEVDPKSGLVETLRAVRDVASRPLVLFFDQFEELFIFHEADVRRNFAGELQSIHKGKLNVKIIIGIRQDYLAHLSELEETVDGVFENRFWLRRMSRENAAEAVVKACQSCDVKIDAAIPQTVLHRLDPRGHGIELPYLQVVMDRLYRQAIHDNPDQPVISSEKVKKLGDIADILATFLAEEVEKLPAPETGRQILKAFVTREGTRRNLDRQAVANDVASFGEGIRADILDDHLNQLARVRVLREIADTGSFELRHDALAATVASWISEIEKKLIEVRDNLINRFNEYEARGRPESALLDEGFLDYLSDFQSRLTPLLSDSARRYVAGSQRHVKTANRRKQRAKQILIASAVATVVAIAAIVWFVQKNEKSKQAQQGAKQGVENLVHARPDAVPLAIKLLEPLKRYAVKPLQEEFEKGDDKARLHVACALAEFKLLTMDQVSFLVESIPRTDGIESLNLVTALSKAEHHKAAWLQVRQKFQEEKNQELKIRWATALLSLGETLGAFEMLKSQPNPSDRTSFIASFHAWPGSVAMYPELMRKDSSADFRSGLCLALGTLPLNTLSESETEVLQAVLNELHRDAPESSTHSASSWVLKQWGISPPEIKATTSAAKGFNWYVNKQNMTMLYLPGGKFKMGSDADDAETNQQPAHEKEIKSFYLCDREVTIEQFKSFAAAKYDEEEWTQPWKRTWAKGNDDFPMQGVSWSVAVEFCNWLSENENRTLCYKQEAGEWTFDKEANGYRLPTEAEWEYACRAGTTSKYAFGDDEHRLPDYAVFYSKKSEACGSRLPNAWGLFDMHGNVWEWCQDLYGPYPADETSQKSNTERKRVKRVNRGGSYLNDEWELRSAKRSNNDPKNQHDTYGLRVARSSD